MAQHRITLKSKLLYNVFFRSLVENDSVDPDFNYDPPICDFEPITDQQIYHTIAKLAPHKAPGLNGIRNIVFTKCADLIVPHMAPIFRATFTLKIYPNDDMHKFCFVHGHRHIFI
jgi:hypothetical protein